MGLEQTALDNGQMDIGLLLALVEDPPAALFSNRAVAPLSRGRAFAPMAEQRWITTALSYIKELDAISNRRSDFTAAPSRTSGGGGGADGPTPKPKARKQPKAAWKRRGGGAVKKDCKPIAVSKHSGENSPDPVEPNVPDVVPLGQSIPTMKLLAAFPRWTLKARSNFSWILARTFSLRCRGHAGPRFCFRGLSAPFDGFWTFPVEWPQAMWSEVEVHRFAEDLTCRDRGSQLLAQRLPAF